MTPLSPDEDTKLLQGLHKGEEKAFSQLFNEYYRSVFLFAKGLTKDTHQAQDITTNTFIKFFDYLQTNHIFDNLYKVKGFLYITARNACFDYIKSNKPIHLSQSEIDLLLEQPDRTVLERMTESEVLAEIYSEIEKLSNREKEILKLAYLEGLDTNQIAKKLDISVNTVKDIRRKALIKLRAAILKNPLLLFILFGIGPN